jgi:MFS family permease
MADLMSAGAGPFLGEAVLRLFHGNFTPVFLTASLISFGGFLISTGIRDVRRTNHLPEFGFRGLLRRFDIATVLFASLVFGIAAGVVVNFIASYSRETALDSVAPFLISYSSAAVLVRLLASRASDLVGRTPIITPALLIFSVGLAALSFPVFFKYAWAIGFLMGCGHGLIYPAMNALAIERAGEKDMGSANALFSGAVDVGVFGGSVVFGEVAEAMSVRGMFLYCGLAVAGGLIIFLILEKVLCRSCTDGPNRAQQ